MMSLLVKGQRHILNHLGTSNHGMGSHIRNAHNYSHRMIWKHYMGIEVWSIVQLELGTTPLYLAGIATLET